LKKVAMSSPSTTYVRSNKVLWQLVLYRQIHCSLKGWNLVVQFIDLSVEAN